MTFILFLDYLIPRYPFTYFIYLFMHIFIYLFICCLLFYLMPFTLSFVFSLVFNSTVSSWGATTLEGETPKEATPLHLV